MHPELTGGAPVPITVTPGDVNLATSLIVAAGGLAGASGALSAPGGLGGLSGGRNITPGAALEYLQGVRNKEAMAKLAAEDKPLDGSIGGVVPGPPGQVLQGAWNTTLGTGRLLLSEATHPGSIPGAVSGYLSWAVNHPGAWAKQTIDWNDWSHGRPFQAVGAIGAGVLEAKGAGQALHATPGLLARNPALRDFGTQGIGKVLDPHVPHAGDVLGAVAPYTAKSLSEVTGGAHMVVQKFLTATGTTLVRYKLKPVVARLASELPNDPKIIIVADPPKVIYHPPTVVRPPIIVRKVPRGR